MEVRQVCTKGVKVRGWRTQMTVCCWAWKPRWLGFLHCDVIYLLRFTYLSGSLLKKNFMKNRRKVQADVFSIPSHIIFKYTKILA